MDPVTDPRTDSIDREIARALAVEPSPEFVARVRTRIGEEPAPAAWGIQWMLGAVAVVASIVVAVVIMRPEPRVEMVSPLVARVLKSEAIVPVVGPAEAGPHEDQAGRHEAQAGPHEDRSPSYVGSAFRRTYIEPAVLFDTREVAALQRLVAAPIAVAAERPAMDLAPVENIVIAPIAIDPLEPGGQGERQ